MLIGLVFHLTNSQLFHIGIFPWFAIAANLLFLPSGWPRRCYASPWGPACGVRNAAVTPSSPHPCGMGLYAAVQILLPLRLSLSGRRELDGKKGICFVAYEAARQTGALRGSS
ncbi:MAG: HTTM domain-containing protein [Chloroflexi bacterium]|nr:HTTM domain-containing protein [Chloroflexota bacterium]